MNNKIYKILSIVLAIILVFSCCAVSFGTLATGTEHTYYISSTGDDSNDGTAVGTPFKTYKGAIARITADAVAGGFNTANDTVYLKVNSNNDTTPWRDSTQSSYGSAAHNFKLVITTDGTPSQAFLGSGNTSIELNGPTVFEKLYFDYGRTATGAYLAVTDSLIFDSSVMQRKMAGPVVLGTINNTATTTTFDKPITFTNNSTWLFRKIVLGSQLNSVHNADVNVVINNNQELPNTYNSYTYTTHNFAFGSLTAGYTATFNKNVNFNFINAADVTLIKGTGNFAFGDDAAVQILNATGKAIHYDDTMQAALFGNSAQVDTYVFANNTGINDLITFTDTAGTYSVNTAKYTVTATSVTDSTVVYEAADGKLTVPAGEYTLDYSVPPVEKTYYVSASGNDSNNGEEATPFKTIGGALTAAVAAAEAGNYNYSNSTVNFKVLGTDPIFYNNMGGIAFDFKLNISSETSGAVLANGAEHLITSIEGNVNFENIDVQIDSWNEVYLNGKNITFGENATFTPPQSLQPDKAQLYFCLGATNSAKTFTKAQNVKFVNKGTRAVLNLAIGGSKTTIYNADLNFVYNAPFVNGQLIRFSTVSSAAKLTFNKNVNIDIKSGEGIEFWTHTPSRCVFGDDSAFQVINSTGSNISYTDTMESILPEKTYKLNNTTGIKDLIGFTDTAGEYTINANPDYVIKAVPKTGDPIVATGGMLTLTTPGEYEIILERDPIIKEYYVSASGNHVERGTRPATAGTKEDPVKSFADVTFLIEQDGLTKLDIAKVYFKSGERIGWNTESEENPSDDSALINPIKHACKVEIDSTNPGDKALIANYYSIYLCGDTVFKNVIVNVDYQYAIFGINNNNVTFEEGSEVSVPKTYLYDRQILTYDKDLNIVIKGSYVSNNIILGASYHTQSTTGNLNFYIDNPNAQATFMLSGGSQATGPQVYDGNINIIAKNAKTLGVSVGNLGANVNGALHILADGDLAVPYSFKQNFENLDVAGGKWLITNIAADDDFVEFTEEKGKLNVKGGATAYSRQLNADMVTHKGGTIDFSAAPGVYTVSDKPIDELTDESHKMLYFYATGGVHKIMSQTYVQAGETYIYELSIYCNNIDEIQLLLAHPNTDRVLADYKIISKEKIDNYYRIKGEVVVPDSFEKTIAHVGVMMPGYPEGVLFDRVFYRKDDPDKKDLTGENQMFYDGLDGIKFDGVFWGNIFTGSKGGKGITKWTDGLKVLEIVNFSTDYIAELIKLANPDDGEWWKDSDLLDDTVPDTYATAKGVFKDSDGNPIKNAKMLLVSGTKTYTATTNSSGAFNFGKVITGYYELFVMDGDKKLETGYAAFLSEDDVISFNVTSDISELKEATDNDGNDISGTDYEVVDDGDNVEEIGATSNLSGTVYTPYLKTVPNLKIYLRGIGEVVTDENGNFAFLDIPAGEYDIYTILADNSEYVLRKVTLGENQNLAVKLKYDPAVAAEANANYNWIIWALIISSIALAGVIVAILLLLFKRKQDIIA